MAKTRRVGDAAVLVALQPHALAARHLRHLVEREDQQLAVLADDRDDGRPRRRRRARISSGASTFITCLPLRVLASDLVLGHDEAAPLGRGDEQLPLGIVDEDGDDVLGRVHVDHQRIGSPWPRPPGSLSAPSV